MGETTFGSRRLEQTVRRPRNCLPRGIHHPSSELQHVQAEQRRRPLAGGPGHRVQRLRPADGTAERGLLQEELPGYPHRLGLDQGKGDTWGGGGGGDLVSAALDTS
jgi:hypothetical protein